MDELDITGIDLPDLIIALHAGTEAVGLKARHDIRRRLKREEAELILKNSSKTAPDGSIYVYLGYVYGRPVKVSLDLRESKLREAWLYDRDCPNGPGSCERIVEELRARRKQ